MPNIVLPILLAASLGATIVAAVLWTGMAGLTIGLLLLMRTRWGQARPLSKCFALSIYAHVLLMTYAYSTKLVIPAPPGESTDMIVPLSLIAAADDDEEQTPTPRDDKAHDPAPWDPVPSETPPEFSLAEPARQDTQLPADQPLLAEKPVPPPDEPPSDLPPIADPPRPSIETPPTKPKPAAVAAAPPPTDIPNVQRKETIEPLLPQAASPKRLDVVAASPAAELETKPARTQELTDTLIAADLADALASRQDIVRAADKSESPIQDAASAPAANEPPIAWITRQLNTRVPRRLADGEPVPELYRLRVAHDRKRIARKLGATKESDEAVERALRWLAANQADDGHWSAKQFGAGLERKVAGQDRQGAGADADTGITALAILAMLGAGHTHLEGPYRENVQRGLEYLVREQKDDGSLAGDAKLFAMMYCHGMGTLALGEAYAMTGDHRLEPAVKKAGEFTIRAQHGTTGGWRYLPGDVGDMSQFGWQVMALKSASLAGVEPPEKTRAGMLRFLHNNTSGRARGLASYRAGERPSRTMTAEAFACRIFLGLESGPELTDEMAAFLLEEPPRDGKPDFYYWYYGSLAMFQLQDERWQTWNEALQRELIGQQLSDGDLAGSFDTNEVWSGYGGRVYTTAMGALCLEVYYRYLPVYGDDTNPKR